MFNRIIPLSVGAMLLAGLPGFLCAEVPSYAEVPAYGSSDTLSEFELTEIKELTNKAGVTIQVTLEELTKEQVKFKTANGSEHSFALSEFDEATVETLLALFPEPRRYELVWNDEFEKDGKPDPEKWGYDIGGDGWGNGESQHYTDRIENARVESGSLIIEARKEAYEGNDYTSARLISKEKGDWTGGYYEIRAKLPAGRGLWPAIWMLPTDWVHGGWPDSGEIDIMEWVGVDPDRVHGTIHTQAYNHMHGTQRGGHLEDPTLKDGWHTYAIEWTPEHIRWFCDGREYFSTDNEGLGWPRWPFDERFHLLLNIAVGGSWGGMEGIDDSIFPQTFEIDYVRVFQNAEDEAGFAEKVEPSEEAEGEAVAEEAEDWPMEVIEYTGPDADIFEVWSRIQRLKFPIDRSVLEQIITAEELDGTNQNWQQGTAYFLELKEWRKEHWVRIKAGSASLSQVYSIKIGRHDNEKLDVEAMEAAAATQPFMSDEPARALTEGEIIDLKKRLKQTKYPINRDQLARLIAPAPVPSNYNGWTQGTVIILEYQDFHADYWLVIKAKDAELTEMYRVDVVEKRGVNYKKQ